MFAISAMKKNDVNTTIECLTEIGNVVSLMRERLMVLLGRLNYSLINLVPSYIKLWYHNHIF